MINYPLIGLWVIVVILLIATVTVSVIAMQRWVANSYVVVPDTTPKCEPAFDTIPDVTTLQCCLVGSTVTGNKYFPSIDMVITPAATPYITSCAGFCTQGVSTDDQSQCTNGVGQAAYTTCLTTLKPNGCIGLANPVGHIGVVYYYGLSATNASCPLTAPCS